MASTKTYLHVIHQGSTWHKITESPLLSEAFKSAVQHKDGFVVVKEGRKRAKQVQVQGVVLSGHMSDVSIGGLFCKSEAEKKVYQEVLAGKHD